LLRFSDIVRFTNHTESPVYKAIKKRLEKPENIKEYRDLNFVLDYMAKKNSYPLRMVAEASALGALQES
jgi:hypothetical protein